MGEGRGDNDERRKEHGERGGERRVYKVRAEASSPSRPFPRSPDSQITNHKSRGREKILAI